MALSDPSHGQNRFDHNLKNQFKRGLRDTSLGSVEFKLGSRALSGAKAAGNALNNRSHFELF
jgi:hypothetical protein